jgi:hypothetical protein
VPPAQPPRKRRRWPWITAGVVVLLLVVFYVIGATHPQSTSTAVAAQITPTAVALHTNTSTRAKPPRTTETPTSTPTHPAKTADDGLTGYGATVAEWNSHHTLDDVFAPGSVYDADPSLPQINGHTGAKYVAVQAAGRVTSYTINLHSAPLSSVESVVAGEFPSDAHVLWTAKKDTCVQVEYASAMVHAAMGNTQVGDAFVQYDDVQPDGSSALNPTEFNEAIVMDLPGAQPDPNFGC